MFKQSDVVKKLATNLLKLHTLEQKATKQLFKDQLAYYDARINQQETYSKGVEKFTGLSENREMQVLDNKLERLATERSFIKQNIALNREAASFYQEHEDAAGKIPTEMVPAIESRGLEDDHTRNIQVL